MAGGNVQVGPEAAAPVEVRGHPVQCQRRHPLTLERGSEERETEGERVRVTWRERKCV